MKRFWMILAIVAVLATVLTCGAFAAAGVATQNYTTAMDDCTLTCALEDGAVKSFTAKYTGSDLIAGNSYILLVVSGSESSYTISEDTILYIDQVDNCDGECVSFVDFEPMAVRDSVVLLGGEFDGATSPKVIGEIALRGVNVAAKVSAYNANVAPVAKLYASTDTTHTTPVSVATVGEATKSGSRYLWEISFGGVMSGEYDLVVTKSGNLPYTVKNVTVGNANLDLKNDENTAISTMAMLAGELTGDTAINISDFTKFRSSYTKSGDAITTAAADINGDGQVNISDFTPFRAGYTKTAASTTFTYGAN